MGVSYGKTSGMSLLEYYAFTFDLNCHLKTKLSDEDIALRIIKEFPHHHSVLKRVDLRLLSRYRCEFNAGRLHKRYRAPKVPCFRYINSIAVNRNGIPYLPSELKRRMKTQIPRWRKDNLRKLKEEAKPPSHQLIKQGVRKAWKQAKKRLKFQKEMAKLHGLPAYPT